MINAYAIQIHIICVLILFFIHFTYQSNSEFLAQSRLFKSLVRNQIILAFVNIAYCFVPENTEIIPSIVDVVKVMLLVRTALLWFLFIYHKTENNGYALRKWAPLIAAPMILVLVYAVIDFVNHYESSAVNPALWAIAAVAGIVYMLAGSSIAFSKSKKCRNIFNYYTYRYLAIIVIFPIIGCFIQFMDLRNSLLEPILTLTILHIYIMSLKQFIPYDLQTGINNDHKLMSYLEEITQKVDANKRLFFIQVGVNNFAQMKKEKGINNAAMVLKDAAKFLQKYCSNTSAFLARNGKDSFAIVLQVENIIEIEKFCTDLLRECENDRLQKRSTTPITLNIYWSEYGTEKVKTLRELVNPANFSCFKSRAN